MFAPIPASNETGPEGPHTRVLPSLIRAGRAHEATALIQDGFASPGPLHLALPDQTPPERVHLLHRNPSRIRALRLRVRGRCLPRGSRVRDASSGSTPPAGGRGLAAHAATGNTGSSGQTLPARPASTAARFGRKREFANRHIDFLQFSRRRSSIPDAWRCVRTGTAHEYSRSPHVRPLSYREFPRYSDPDLERSGPNSGAPHPNPAHLFCRSQWLRITLALDGLAPGLFTATTAELWATRVMGDRRAGAGGSSRQSSRHGGRVRSDLQRLPLNRPGTLRHERR